MKTIALVSLLILLMSTLMSGGDLELNNNLDVYETHCSDLDSYLKSSLYYAESECPLSSNVEVRRYTFKTPLAASRINISSVFEDYQTHISVTLTADAGGHILWSYCNTEKSGELVSLASLERDYTYHLQVVCPQNVNVDISVEAISSGSTPPSNDLCTGAIELFGGVFECGDMDDAPADACATGDFQATGNCVTPADPGVWYTFETPANMIDAAMTFNPVNAVFEIFTTTSDCSGLTYLDCGAGFHEPIPGTIYYLLVTADLTFSTSWISGNPCSSPNDDLLTGSGPGMTVSDSWQNNCSPPTTFIPCNGETAEWYSYITGPCSNADLIIELDQWSTGSGLGMIDEGSLTAFLPDCSTLLTNYDPSGLGYVCSAIVAGETLVLENLPPDTEIVIAVGSDFNEPGYFEISVTESISSSGGLPNDDCANPTTLDGGNNPDLTNVCATPDQMIPSCSAESEATVWFEYYPPVVQDITINIIQVDLNSPAIAAWEDCGTTLLAENCGTTIELSCISTPILIEIGSAANDVGVFELEILTAPAAAPPLPDIIFNDICSETETGILLEYLSGFPGDISVTINPSSSSDISGMSDYTFLSVVDAEVDDLLINCSDSPKEAIYTISSFVPGFNCPGNATDITIVVNPKFNENIVEVEVCLPYLLELDASSIISGGLEPYASIEWLWEGASIANGSNLSYELTESGILTLVVTDNTGCIMESLIEVIAYEELTAQLTAIDDRLCFGPDGTSIVLELITGDEIDDVDWIVTNSAGAVVDIGDGNNSGYTVDGFNPVGDYQIRAIVENSFGCQGESNLINLTILPTPTGEIILETGPNCQSILRVVFYAENGEDIFNNGPDSNSDGIPDAFDLDDDGEADFEDIIWRDPVLGLATTNSLTYAASSNGTYEVEILTDQGCFSEIDPLEVNLGNQIAPILNGPSNVCQGDTLQLYVTPQGYTSYSWTVNGVPAMGLPTDTLEILLTDSLTLIMLDVVDDTGCSFSLSTQVILLTTPSFTLQGSTSICPGLSTTISVLPDPGSDASGWQYAWSDAAGSPLSVGGSTLDINNAGSYQVLVTNTEGCADSLSFQINEDADLSIMINGNDFCQGSTTSLSAGTGFDSYSWRNASGIEIGTSETLIISEGGTYSLEVSLGNCTGTDEITIIVENPPVIVLADQVEVCFNPEGNNVLNLVTLSSGSDLGVWRSDDLPSLDLSNLEAVSFESVAPGFYTLTYMTNVAIAPCIELIQSIEVEVIDCPCPDVGINNFISICNVTPSFNLDDQLETSTIPGSWSFVSGPEVVSIDSDNGITTQNLTTGVYMFNYTSSSPVVGCPDSDFLELTIELPPVVNIAASVEVCNITSTIASTLLNLDDLILDGIGDWVDPLISGLDFSDPQNLDFEGVTNGNYTLTFITTNADFPCLDQTIDIELIVLNCACPILNLSPATDLCNDSARLDLAALAGSSAEGTWSILMTNPTTTVPANDLVDLTGMTPGEYGFVYTLINPTIDCTESDTIRLSLSATPLLSPFMDTVVCNMELGIKSTILDISSLVIGDFGEWIDPQIPGLDFSDPSNLDFESVIPGTYVFIHLTNSANFPCLEVEETLNITVEECLCPVIELETIGDQCNDDAEIELGLMTGNSAPGSWSEIPTNPTTISVQSGTADLTGANTGLYIFIYELMDPILGCPSLDSLEVFLNTTPELVLRDTAICNVVQGTNGTILDFSSLVVSDGGVWMDPAIANLDFSDETRVDFDGLTPGTYSFSYSTNTALPPCMDQTRVITITVLDCNCPIIEIDNIPDFCEGVTTIDLSAYNSLSAPGTWSANDAQNPVGIPVDNAIADFISATAGSYSFTYFLNDPVFGCDSVSSIEINLIAPPVISQLIDTVVCNAINGTMGTLIDLTSLVIGDPGVFLNEAGVEVVDPTQVDFEGLGVDEVISFTYMTDSAVSPCQEVSEELFITIIDCNCNDPRFLDPPILCNGTEEGIDLNDLLLTTHMGTWQIIEQPQSGNQTLVGSILSPQNIEAGTYTVEFELSAPVDNCQAIWEFDLEVVNQDEAVIEEIISLCVGDEDAFTSFDLATAVISGSGVWVDENEMEISDSILSFSTGDEGVYTYAYVVKNEPPCENIRYDLDITVTPCATKIDTLIYFPNLIDINTEGNDIFYVQSNTEGLRIQKLSIYDRWGQLIFLVEDGVANSKEFGWDGTFNGFPVEQGVYVYVIEMEGPLKLIADDLTVLR